jgi:rod shape determining protein RodA
MRNEYSWRNFDWPLLIAVILLCGIGIAMIYSATITTIDLNDYWTRQTLFVVLGLVILMLAALFDYRNMELLALPAYLFFVISLVAVLAVGAAQGGSTRWISVGGTLVQPTEAGKFLVIIFMAWYLSWFYDRMQRLPYLLGALVLLLAPLVLVYLQPDLGMTVTLAFLGGTLILVGGIRFWQIGLMAGAAVAVTPFLWSTLQGYMLERIQVFLDPQGNPDAAFNINQAMIAVGSGGWLGRGWQFGSQNQLHFLRVRHTDFIFSVIAEELGMVGSMLILGLLFFVIWRLLRIADRAQDHFGRLIATGVAALIFFQVFVNVGMNLSMVPVTGLTLPFVSYGGSSLLSMMIAVGLAESVAMRYRAMEN